MSEPEQTPENSTDNWYTPFLRDAPADYGENMTNSTDNWYPSFFRDAPAEPEQTPKRIRKHIRAGEMLRNIVGKGMRITPKSGVGTTGKSTLADGGKRKTQRRNKNNKKTRKHKQKSKSKGKAKKSRKTKA